MSNIKIVYRRRLILLSIVFTGLLLAALAACRTEAPIPTLTPAATRVLTPSATPAIFPATPAPTGTETMQTPGLALTSAPTPTEAPEANVLPADHFPAPPERDLYRLARELIPGLGDIQPTEADPAPTLAVGHRQSFELVDLEKLERYHSEFELRLVTPHAYWFVEDGVRIKQSDIEKSAESFENNTYPQVTATFGTEWTPGVDGDPHLYVFNASLALVGGYYSPSDEYPKEIRPVSNEIEAVYVNVRYISPGTEIYDQVLAHELQHAVHWNADPTEETWLNEGLSELAVTLAGYEELSVHAFRRSGPTSLTIWPPGDVGGAENYGAASLFMHYLTEHYVGLADLRPLLSQQEDGIEGVDAYLLHAGYDVRFEDIFRDWGVANLLDEPTGKYGYDTLGISFPVSRSLRTDDELMSSLPQYSTEYLKLNNDAPASLTFEGDSTARLLPVEVGHGCWWSNSGDVIDSTLTAHADLRRLANPKLDFQVWYSIEEDWDYVYFEASIDGGKTWQILETAYSSSSNPIASAFGPGYTGASGDWQEESISLQKWSGQKIMLRFQYITDAAINDHGLCLRELKLSDASGQSVPLEWMPNGFSWINNRVRQGYNIQVIYEGRSGNSNRVLPMQLDSSNGGEIRLEPDPDALRVVVAVQAMAPSTRLPATYTLKLESTQ